jgi:hypothetical protein
VNIYHTTRRQIAEDSHRRENLKLFLHFQLFILQLIFVFLCLLLFTWRYLGDSAIESSGLKTLTIANAELYAPSACPRGKKSRTNCTKDWLGSRVHLEVVKRIS